MKRNIFIFISVIFLCLNCYSINIDIAIKSTIEKNPKVQIAIEKIKESEELISYAAGSKLPTITGSIASSYSNADTTNKNISTTPETLTDSYKISVTQNIYDSGFNNLEIERSKVLFSNELIKFKSTIQDLLLDAINGYLTVINNEKSFEATQKNYDSVLKAYEETKTRFDLGSATLYDIQNAEASFASAKTSLFASEQNLNISKKTFNRIVGLEPINLEDIININTSIDFDTILKNALINNLEILLITNDIQNKEILILKEKKTKLPSLDVSGTGLYSNGGRIEDGSETTSGSISLTLTVPLYKKGQDKSNIRKYRSQLLQLEIGLLDFKGDLEILIANSYKDFIISESKMESNLIIIKSIETSLMSLNAEYIIGTKTINDLIDEEEKLLNANFNYLDSKKDFLLNYFKIKSLDGSLIKLFDKYLPVIN